MKLAIRKWGNSAAIRLPNSVMNSAHMKINTEVEIKEENGRIIIMSLPKKYDLDDLLKGITSKNCYPEISCGKPVGKEMW